METSFLGCCGVHRFDRHSVPRAPFLSEGGGRALAIKQSGRAALGKKYWIVQNMNISQVLRHPWWASLGTTTKSL
ncbi:MAG: hypothetical protein EBE86_005160 [Hormoscilla sp. GUM202]|nr:hypothetical protein [Hormoscilla sp. GUM202]